MTTPWSFGEAFSLRRSLGDGIKAVRLAPGPMWLGGLLMTISDGCNGASPPTDLDGLLETEGQLLGLPLQVAQGLVASVVGVPSSFTDGLGDMAAWVVGFVVVFVLFGLAIVLGLFALNSWLQTGFVRMHVEILERRSDDLTPLFSGRDRFWAMAGYKALSSLVLTGALLSVAWPGLALAAYGAMGDDRTLLVAGAGMAAIFGLPAVVYAALGTFLGELVVALEGEAPMRALRRSFALAHGNRMTLLWFSLVCAVVQMLSLAGLLLCCVGVLATLPFAVSITEFAKTEAFLLYTRGTKAAEGFALWDPDPLPPAQAPEAPAAS
ncbi:MAG: hypothetical protein OEZ06_01840 [Myxococcales bacterium]|nr:hypothetical protein [Myxococcales bacterium]